VITFLKPNHQSFTLCLPGTTNVVLMMLTDTKSPIITVWVYTIVAIRWYSRYESNGVLVWKL